MMNDKDLEKLMKKSARKQIGKIVLWSVLIVLIILGGGGLAYSNQYNYWPFNEGKISGIPDNTMIKIDRGDEAVTFGPEDGIMFNVNANQVVVTMDYYEKDKKIDSKELLTISAKDSTTEQISGTIRWIQNDWGVTLDNLKIGASVSGIQNQAVYSMKAKKDTKEGASMGGANSGVDYYSQKVTKDTPYIMGSWGFGYDSATSIMMENGKVRQSDLETNEESYILMVTFK